MGASIGIVAVVLFISFFIFLALGLQVSVGIGLSSFIALLLSLPFDMTVIASAQKMITGLDNFALLAIPFFILSGNIIIPILNEKYKENYEKIQQKLKKVGLKNKYKIINGEELIIKNKKFYYDKEIHPNELGFTTMALNLINKL